MKSAALIEIERLNQDLKKIDFKIENKIKKIFN
jgi:hypothetical protein